MTDHDQLLVEIAADVADATALEEVIEPADRRLARLRREHEAARRQSLWNRVHSSACPTTTQQGKSAATCTCSEDGPIPGPNAKMLAEVRARQICALCGEHAAHVLGGKGYCRTCIKSDDVHTDGCATIGSGDLLACDCGIRARLVAEQRR